MADVNKAAARFDLEKLSWLNQHYLKSDDPAEIAPHLEWHLRMQGFDPAHGPAAEDVVVALRDRAHTLNEMAEKATSGTARSRNGTMRHRETSEVRDGRARTAGRARAARQRAGLDVENVHKAIEDAAAAIGEGMGKVAQPLRVAMTGTQVSPSIDHTVYLVGRERALRRIEDALAKAGCYESCP